MAVIHQAQITPTKAELIAGWLPSRPWCGDGNEPIELLGAYRFDDPAGEVGIETHLVRTARGSVLQVPLTYRGAPQPGAEPHLVATTEHSHLGRRWVYDGCADPVYATALATAIRTGGHEAEEWVEADGGPVRRTASAQVTGSGTDGAAPPPIHAVTAVDGREATTIQAPGLELVVLRAVDRPVDAADAGTLTGTWPGRTEPALLAVLRR